MSKALCIVIGLTIAATFVSAALGQQPSPIQRIIAQEDAKGVALHRAQTPSDGRSPDTIDAAVQARSARSARPGVDLRSPDTSDAALAAHSSPAQAVVIVGASGFDWADAGIGGAAVFALTLLAAGGMTLVRDSRRQKALG
jgi:hypothetical protein